MSSNDFKQLTHLYEEITQKDSFYLLKQEEELFDKIAKELINRTYKYLKRNNFNFPHLTYLGEIVGSISNTRQYISEFFPERLQEDCAWCYFGNVVIYVIRNQVVLKQLYEPEEMKCFEFGSSKMHGIWRRVNVEDKNKVEKTLKEWFIKRLNSIQIRLQEEHPEWHKWREQQIQVSPIINRLPELEGMF